MAFSDHKPKDEFAKIRLRVFLTMLFERMWPLLLPLLITLALLAILSWFGLFNHMPYWLHLTVLSLLFVVALVTVFLPARVRIPTESEVNQRIESINALSHQPLRVQSDHMAIGDDDPLAQVLWHEHQRRMASQLKNLQSGLPDTRIAERDPLGIRALVLLLLVTSFAFSYGSNGGRLTDMVHLPEAKEQVAARIDAWVTPPRYTGKAPIFLNAESDEQAEITVPQGSIFSLRVSGSAREYLIAEDASGKNETIQPELAEDEAEQGKTKPSGDTRNFQYELHDSQTMKLTVNHRSQSWKFAVTPDKAPQISFTKTPDQARNGTLQLHYKITDDYPVASAYAEITPLGADDHEVLMLYEAPELALNLPRKGSEDASTNKDLTTHPWAGSEVELTLVVNDQAGQVGYSETRAITLPERIFTNPLAKAIIEQRRILAMDAMQNERVLDMLDAVMLRPADTIKNAGHFLGLRTIRTRLSLAHSEDDLRNVVDYMWEVARGIEDGYLSDAEKRLRMAQEALRNAIENGASQEEIAKLSNELREAMAAFLKEFAKTQQNNQNPALPPNANVQTLTDKDLQNMMDRIENLARQGSRDEAQELLSQLENLMNNLQMGQGQAQGQNGQNGQNGQSQQSQMQNQMNKLGELMRRQQQTMNETFSLDQRMQQQFGDNDEDFFSENEDAETTQPPLSPDIEETMKNLQRQQKQLQSDLKKLSEDLKALGIDPSKEFKDAEKSMGNAGEALGRNESAQANDDQGSALDALRRGSRDMMKKMQEAMGQGEGQGQGQNGRQGESQAGKDPLGRNQGQTGPDFGNDTKVPGEIDIQRAREILDEIRRRLGDALSPQMEKDYLERLLKFD
ncbi:TIGR02302 family protein [Paenochrobactrum sp. BZR 588]|uniref:TIGR02302 family protein n=1 Tax=unclassified Paenochrobactrum TaxID=2639760 RepID=UPI0038547717